MLETTGGINTVNMAGAYPGMGGDSIGLQASAFTDYSASAPEMPMMSGAMSAAMPMPAPANGGSSPAVWWATIAILLFALMWAAERFGSEGPQFSNIRLSLYNMLILTFAVVLGMTLIKVPATKFPNNPVSQLILAA